MLGSGENPAVNEIKKKKNPCLLRLSVERGWTGKKAARQTMTPVKALLILIPGIFEGYLTLHRCD